MHAVSVFLVAIAVVLLMAPAAYHRIVYAGEVSEDMHRVGHNTAAISIIPVRAGTQGFGGAVGGRFISIEPPRNVHARLADAVTVALT